MEREWDNNYVEGDTPWDSGFPEPLLVKAVEESRLPGGRLLEIGCGTGTNARMLADAGFHVTAVDLSPTAIEMARERTSSERIVYRVLDIITEPLPEGPFDAVVDRGCFHVFGDPELEDIFVDKVTAVLRPGGCWLSLIGSTEGGPRDHGPPRRSARDIVRAVEPKLEIVALESACFSDTHGKPAAWFCLSRKREQPAQPATAYSPG